MTGKLEWERECSRPTYSFYLTASRCSTDPVGAIRAAQLAGSITIAGADGPRVVRRLRAAGLEVPVRFDAVGYDGKTQFDPTDWIRRQREAAATQLLLPGTRVPWEKGNADLLSTIVSEQSQYAIDLGASLLLAIDPRWLARDVELLVEVLRAAGQPTAIVLVHRDDPLSVGGAVAGLRFLASRLEDLVILRCDHGAIGALAFGARHASLGLTTGTRHYAPPDTSPWKRPGSSARLFDRDRLDWFLASDIAAWESARGDFICRLDCCAGLSLARFLDPDEDSDLHNMTSLKDFADYIVLAEAADRGSVFMRACEEAVSLYGLAGFHGPENPKAQLTGWAFS